MKIHQRRLQRPPATMEAERLLSPQCALVVHFREGLDATQGGCSGRVEHIVSGHAARFSSLEELLAFFSRILVTVRARPQSIRLTMRAKS